jgi:4-amino-4-deoxy-L-arabinose transferase-like glycosyltransferase
MQELIATLVDSPCRAIGTLVESRPACMARQRWELPALAALLVLAAVLRLWGVGSFSLHKPDEDTTVLPAVHVLEDGTPRFPSGMFYARAIAQSYLVAGSVKAFGQTEWALRLPSVLTGILLVWLAYLLGRRFLEPVWNMAFVAVVALLPGLIADSQEARMYIFLNASLAAYMILLFRWERTGRTVALAGAVAAMLVALQFQEIAIFSSILVLFPGLAHGDARKLRAGLVALLVMVLGRFVIAHWTGSFYPDTATDLPAVSQTGVVPTAGALRLQWLVLVPAALLGAGIARLVTRPIGARVRALLAAALLLLGLVCQALLCYHLAAVMLVAALVLARRHGGARAPAVGVLLLLSAALAMVQLAMLHGSGITSWRKVFGVMVGQPSIWPYLQVARYSPVAMLLVGAALGAGLWRIAHGRRVRDDVLFAVLGVVVPLFVLGFFGWYIPPRYGEFALLPMVLCALAAAQALAAGRPSTSPVRALLPTPVMAGLAAVLLVNPLALARSVDAGRRFPDHRAAAAYVRSVRPGPHDLVVAEESLLQTYYLGHIDYWLTGPNNAANFVVRVNGRLVDQYTGVPVIYTAADFLALEQRAGRGAIYVIGSGEDQHDGRLYLRGPGIQELLQRPEFVTVYVAPDRLTRVWKIAAPAPAAQDP